MRVKSLIGSLFLSLFVCSVGFAKWVDPEKEAKKNHQFKAWQGVDFTFTGVSSSGSTNSLTYRSAIDDHWEWNAGTGVDSLGWFFTGGGRYFLYNWPHTTCFFAFNCHGQVLLGANLNYANGGRKSYTNGGTESRYDQGNSIYMWPTVAFRSVYRDFFSLSLDVGYRVMVQKASINRSFGPSVQSNEDDMNKSQANGFGASVSLGIVF